MAESDTKTSGEAPLQPGIASWLWGPYSRLGLTVALITLIIDQLNKWWMISVYEIARKGRVEVLPFLDYVFVINKGISYGMLSQDGHGGQWALATFAVFASLALTVWLARGATNAVMAVSIGLIVGGAIGNAIDRIHHGGVADFYSLHAFGFYWYVFNIADVAIVAGVIGLLYDAIVLSRNPASSGT
jgi:signal peptidase II